jgi:flagellar biosynthesis GTPase FlhF
LKEAERLELERKAQEAERIAQEQRYRARKERERAEREQREREAAMDRELEERESRERAERERIEREMRENEQKQQLQQEKYQREQQGSLAINTKEVESFHKEEEKQSRPKLLFSFAIVCCLLFGFLLLKLQKEREAKSPFENSVASTNCGDMRAAIVVYDDFDVGGKLSRWVIFRQALVAVDSGYASYSWPTDVWSFNYVRREGNGELRDATVRYKVEQDSYRVMEATERGTKFIENFTYKYPPDKAGKPTEIWSFCSPNTAIHHRWFASNLRLRSDFPPPKPPLK